MAQLYVPMLSLHNTLRWVVIITALYALYRYYTGLMQRKEFAKSDRQAGLFFMIAMDLQLLVGLLLYFVISPITQSGMQNMAAAMQDSRLRFIMVEHMTIMIVAVILVHIGYATVKRADNATSKFRRGAIWYSLTILAVLAGIPWWQPLLRLPV